MGAGIPVLDGGLADGGHVATRRLIVFVFVLRVFVNPRSFAHLLVALFSGGVQILAFDREYSFVLASSCLPKRHFLNFSIII